MAPRKEYSQATISQIRKLMSLLLEDAVIDGRLDGNPLRARRRRRGRGHRPRAAAEKVWATPAQVLQVAENAAILGGQTAFLLVVTFGYTGMRWGEAAGLRRPQCLVPGPQGSMIRVLDDEGALKEVNGELFFGEPKTVAGGRDIVLPPFLADLLGLHLDGLTGELVFTGPQDGMLRRSTFGRDVWRPACDGRAKTQRRPAIAAACPGLTPHGLRHGHNTWLAEAGVAEVARCARLGWEMPDKIQSIYSHVSVSMERHIVEVLERLWRDALAERARIRPHSPVPVLDRLLSPYRGETTPGEPAGADLPDLPRHEIDPPRRAGMGL